MVGAISTSETGVSTLLEGVSGNHIRRGTPQEFSVQRVAVLEASAIEELFTVISGQQDRCRSQQALRLELVEEPAQVLVDVPYLFVVRIDDRCLCLLIEDCGSALDRTNLVVAEVDR